METSNEVNQNSLAPQDHGCNLDNNPSAGVSSFPQFPQCGTTLSGQDCTQCSEYQVNCFW